MSIGENSSHGERADAMFYRIRTHESCYCPLGALVIGRNCKEANQQEHHSARNHSPIKDEATSVMVHGVERQQVSDNL